MFRMILVLSVAVALTGLSMPSYANPDGSCTLHYKSKGDVHVLNGATYHQVEQRGSKSGIVYVPDKTFQCKDGHLVTIAGGR
jgi:hypothetical protein